MGMKGQHMSLLSEDGDREDFESYLLLVAEKGCCCFPG